MRVRHAMYVCTTYVCMYVCMYVYTKKITHIIHAISNVYTQTGVPLDITHVDLSSPNVPNALQYT